MWRRGEVGTMLCQPRAAEAGRGLGQSLPRTLQREPVLLICDLGLPASQLNLWPHSLFLFVVVALGK